MSNIALPTSRGAGLGHGVAQQESLALEDAVAQPFVGRAAFVGRLGRAGEPALVDAAAVRAQAYQSVGASLIRLPGCKKLRGTQFGVNRKKPPPASIARSRIAPTLSFVTIGDAHMMAPCSRMNVGTVA